jgi:hypothetical protein
VSDSLAPWWIASATGLVTFLAGVIGKLWTDGKAEVRELRAELAAANARLVELQTRETSEHVRDLRRIAGISTSQPAPAWPPPVIRRKRQAVMKE